MLVKTEIKESKYYLIPLIFIGKQYEILFWQMSMILIANVLFYSGYFFYPIQYTKAFLFIANGQIFLMPVAIWMFHCLKNYLFLFMFRVK